MKIQYYILLSVLFLSSCGTLKEYEGKTVAVDCNVIQYPTVVDLDIKESASGSTEWKEKWFGKKIPLDIRKGNLIAEIIGQSKADVLVEPRFTIESGSSGMRSYKITVSGYPATFKNFRPATLEDINVLRAASCHQHSHNLKMTEKYEAKTIKKGNFLPTVKSWFGK